MQVLSAALGLGRDDAGEFDETYYEEDDYEASLDDDADADETLGDGDPAEDDEHDEHDEDGHA
jgi:23S rRNA pseudouridine1911/1915/1917 synthase